MENLDQYMELLKQKILYIAYLQSGEDFEGRDRLVVEVFRIQAKLKVIEEVMIEQNTVKPLKQAV